MSTAERKAREEENERRWEASEKYRRIAIQITLLNGDILKAIRRYRNNPSSVTDEALFEQFKDKLIELEAYVQAQIIELS